MLAITRGRPKAKATGLDSASTGSLRSSGVVAWSSQSEWPPWQHFQSNRVVARHAKRRASEMWDLSSMSGPPHRHVITGAPPLPGTGASFGSAVSLRFYCRLGLSKPGGLAVASGGGERPRQDGPGAVS